jgi:rRNA-processing protein FCF1
MGRDKTLKKTAHDLWSDGLTEQFLIDSHIHDRIIDVPSALDLVTKLVRNGTIRLLTTHVQADELARTPDEQRRAALMAVPAERVLAYGFVLDTSRLDEARLGESGPIESLRRGNPVHTEDALIGASAQYENATLVTEDRTLRFRAGEQGIPVLSWLDFHALMVDRSTP